MSFAKPWGNYLLDGIKETIAPEAISFWPQTIAWQVLFIILVLFTLKKLYTLWRNYQDNAYRREALAWLAQCSLTNENDVRQLPTLVRKTAMLAKELTIKNGDYDNEIVARENINYLSGNDWTNWLDKQCVKTRFSHANNNANFAMLLAQLPYIPTLNLSDNSVSSALTALYQQIELWIKYHDIGKVSSAGSKGKIHD